MICKQLYKGLAAVRAVRTEQADGALGVAKRHQVLSKDADTQRRTIAIGQLGADEDRLPILAQQIAHRPALPRVRHA